MDDVTQFVIRYSSLVLFAAVFVDQVGLPIPAFPVLLAAGALAGAGQMNLGMAVGLGVTASLVGDFIWYYLGLYRGRHVLNLLCRISFEPDSCVRRTENFFGRHGMRSLVLAKFIPAVSTVTPALAGLFNVSIGRFLFYDGLGALLWTAAFIALGYLFSDQLEQIAAQAARFGGSFVVLIVGALALYISYKYINRQLILRKLRIARITADELKRMMDDGHEMMIVDLRQPLDIQTDPYTIPGALRMAMEELEQRHHEIPRDRDVILYCACPNEATAARTALLLKKNGITRVRPLAGGVEAWRASNYPLQKLGEQVA